MINYDFSPFYRSSVGFDHLFSLLDSARRVDQGGNTYPPYNIETTDEDSYRISMAVAGFTQPELNIESRENTLKVTGEHRKQENKKYLYQGIAARNFERTFQLADYVKVVNAKLENGLLHIDLVREIPEAKKPRTIEIMSDDNRYIEADKAAG